MRRASGKYWPYTDKEPDFDADPSAFVYAVADNYEALKYFCHDAVSAKTGTGCRAAQCEAVFGGGGPVDVRVFRF